MEFLLRSSIFLFNSHCRYSMLLKGLNEIIVFHSIFNYPVIQLCSNTIQTNVRTLFNQLNIMALCVHMM